jgi:hypothetical protein
MWSLLLIAALLILPLGAAQGAGLTVPTRTMLFQLSPAAYAGLGAIPTVRTLDYGGFFVLELDAVGQAALQASGVSYIALTEAHTIGTNIGYFDPLEGEPSIPAALRAQYAPGANGLYFVQFVGPIQDAWLGGLAGRGIQLVQYFASNSYLVWMNDSQAVEASNLSYVRWVGPYHYAYRTGMDLLGRSGLIANVTVLVYNHDDIGAVRQAIEATGATFVRDARLQPEARGQWILTYVIDGARIVDVARVPEVMGMAEILPLPQHDDELSDQIIAGNLNAAGTQPSGPGYIPFLASKGLSGTNLIISVVDEGVNETHPELAGRQVYQVGSGPMGHGTHVAGIALGSGSSGLMDSMGYLYGLGVGPWLRYGDHYFSDSHQNYTAQAVLNNSILTQNSWNEGAPAGYTANCALYDRLVRDGNQGTPTTAEPVNVIFSAGNSGPGGQTLTQPHEAKNIIPTASSVNWRSSAGVPGSGNINSISSFSSRGPCRDGRLCPYITTPGQNVVSTRNPAGGTCSSPTPPGSTIHSVCSGTSMAAPHTSGSVAMVTQWWMNSHSGQRSSPAMNKALLMNSAIDMGTPDIPNNNEGWGRINLGGVFTTTQRFYIDQQVVFGATGEMWQIDVMPADASKPLKVTLVWSDAPGPGTGGTTPAWVNNLDLVLSQGANTYYGNVFSAGWSQTGGSPDTRNNHESVHIQTPSGTYRMQIMGTAISGDGVPYNQDTTDQDFALVCDNCMVMPTSVTVADFGAQPQAAQPTLWLFAIPAALLALGALLVWRRKLATREA